MKKILVLLVTGLLKGTAAMCCSFCNDEIREAIFNSRFYPNLLLMCSAFIALAIAVFVLAMLTRRRYRANVSKYPNKQILNPMPLFCTALILGIGMGGFIDGIVLHQILQWHEMLSNKIPPIDYVNKSVNMFWDGLFHLVTWAATMVGIVLLWNVMSRRDIDRSGSLFAGGLIMGWGVFNIVEGVIDHHLLKLHNVREITFNKDLWNYGFLVFSLALIALGSALAIKRK